LVKERDEALGLPGAGLIDQPPGKPGRRSEERRDLFRSSLFVEEEAGGEDPREVADARPERAGRFLAKAREAFDGPPAAPLPDRVEEGVGARLGGGEGDPGRGLLVNWPSRGERAELLCLLRQGKQVVPTLQEEPSHGGRRDRHAFLGQQAGRRALQPLSLEAVKRPNRLPLTGDPEEGARLLEILSDDRQEGGRGERLLEEGGHPLGIPGRLRMADHEVARVREEGLRPHLDPERVQVGLVGEDRVALDVLDLGREGGRAIGERLLASPRVAEEKDAVGLGHAHLASGDASS